jgi:hypothetical protein
MSASASAIPYSFDFAGFALALGAAFGLAAAFDFGFDAA